MPHNFYLVMKGTTQGKLKAGTPKKAKPGTVDFLQVYLGHKLLPGVLSNAVSGTPKQKAFTIGKQTDAASIPLMRATSAVTQSLQIPIGGFGSNQGRGSSSGSGSGSSSKPPFNSGKVNDGSSASLFQSVQSAANTQSFRIPHPGFEWNPSKGSSSGTGSGSSSKPPSTPARH